MKKLNEKEIIKIFQKAAGNNKFIAEDVETFQINKNNIAVKVDTLVKTTDIPMNTKIEDIARKSIISCISDFAAKGINPKYGIISTIIPKNITQKKITRLANSLGKTMKEFKIKLLGGDTSEGQELIIQIFLIGIYKKIVRRSGAREDDVIIATGSFGYQKIGLNSILQKQKKQTNIIKKSKRSIIDPPSRLKFNIKNSIYFSSAMDSSDGLSTTLHELAKQSKKKMIITKLPIDDGLMQFIEENKLDVIDIVFNSGEEYETIATINPINLQKIKDNAKINKITLFEIGYVKKGSGVYYKKNYETIPINDKGWMHLN